MNLLNFAIRPHSYLKSIYFDSEKRIDFSGYFLLLIGSIVFGLSIYCSLKTSKQIVKTNAEIVSIQNLTDSTQATRVDGNDVEKKEIIEKITQEMNYPWDMFFSILEAVHTSEISLMSIQPNIGKKEILISAETANSHLMLEYIRALERQKGVDHFELLSQEMTADNQQERVSFSVLVKLL